MRVLFLVPIAPVLLAGCGIYAFDGVWLGACEAPETGARVQVEVIEQDDDTQTALVDLHRADRAGEELVLDCATIGRDGTGVTVSGCQGSWDGTGGAHDFTLSGDISQGDLVRELAGSCTFDGLNGDLDLWRLP